MRCRSAGGSTRASDGDGFGLLALRISLNDRFDALFTRFIGPRRLGLLAPEQHVRMVAAENALGHLAVLGFLHLL